MLPFNLSLSNNFLQNIFCFGFELVLRLIKEINFQYQHNSEKIISELLFCPRPMIFENLYFQQRDPKSKVMYEFSTLNMALFYLSKIRNEIKCTIIYC